MIRRLLAGLLIALAPVAAFAQIMLTGVGAGASVNYVPAAMVFNYDTWVGATSAIGSADLKPFTFAWWWFGNWNANNTNSIQNDYEFQSAPTGTSNRCEVTAGTAPGVCLSHDSPLHGQYNWNNSTGVTPATDAIKIGSNSSSNTFLTPINQMNFQVVTGDPATGHFGVSLNGVDVTSSFNGSIANTTPYWLTNPGGFGINGRGISANTTYMWMSEVYLDNVAHLNGASGVDPAFIAKLYSNGLPVDTGSDCHLPTGTAPAVCIHYLGGNSISNTGTANLTPFTVQTATWNGGAGTGLLSAAPYGPAGIPAHQATTRWITEKRFWGLTAGATSGATTADGATMSTGDVVWIAPILNKSGGDVVQYMIGGNVADGSCTSGTNCTCPTGWGQVAPMNDTYRLTNSALCYHKTVGGDTGGVYTLTFNALANVRNNFYTMGVVANVASIEAANENAANLVVGSRTLTPSTTNVVTTHANDTVISIFGQQSNSNFTTIDAPPSGDALLREVINTGSQAGIYVVEKHGLALGASSTLQMTYHEGANDTFHPYSLVLQSN